MSLLKDKPLKKCHTDNRKMIDDIHTEKEQNLSEEELNEYYLDNGLLLDKYYRTDNKTNQTNTNKGILSFFNDKQNKEEDSSGKKENQKKIS